MENSTFIIAYLIGFIGCATLTFLIAGIVTRGTLKFFEGLFKDAEIAAFFSRLVRIIIILGGMGAALSNNYVTDEKSSWLTMTWDVADQFKETLINLYSSVMILGLFFMVLLIIDKRLSK